MHDRFFGALLLPALLLAAVGCGNPKYPRGETWPGEHLADGPGRAAFLRQSLLDLGPGVDETEARLVAETAFSYTDELVRKYRLVRPRELHNVLVNMKLRPRGLCYQWAEDMFLKLNALDLETFQLHWAVAAKGDLWHEHSSVVLTARGEPFERGLVIDSWRNEGRLTWARVAEDERYPWVRYYKTNFTAPEESERASESQLAQGRPTAGEPQLSPEPQLATERAHRMQDVDRRAVPHAPASRGQNFDGRADGAGARN